jgi:hypothetical protein
LFMVLKASMVCHNIFSPIMLEIVMMALFK